MKNKVISIGYGEHLFTEDNVERLRVEACAKVTDAYSMVVFVRDKKLTKTTSASGLTLYPITARFGLIKLIKAVFLVRNLIKGDGKEVIVTAQDPFETGLVGWLATRFSDARLNVQEHGDVFSMKYWKEEKLSNTFRFYLGLFILRRADSVRSVSARISNTLQKHGIKKEKIKNLAVLTDPTPFISLSQKSEVRNMFKADSFIMLTVARFVPQKNFKLMLDAFYKAHKQSPKLRLIIIGQGPDIEVIESTIKANEESNDEQLVKVLPWTNDVPGFMASVDAYVLSSNYEGWGRVLIEAMYAKLPVVTTNVGCVGEVILDNKHGLVVPTNDEVVLTEAMIKLSTEEDLYKSIKNNLSTETVPSNISYDSYAKDWIATLS